MFGIDAPELLVILVVALLLLGPKELPRLIYKIGKLVGQARGIARHYQIGLDTMMREAELAEMQAQSKKDPARHMALNPVADRTGQAEASVESERPAQAPGEPEPQPDPELQYGNCRLQIRASANVESAALTPDAPDAGPEAADYRSGAAAACAASL